MGQRTVEVADHRGYPFRGLGAKGGVRNKMLDRLIERRLGSPCDRGEEAARIDAEPCAEAREGCQVWLSAGLDPAHRGETDSSLGGRLSDRQPLSGTPLSNQAA
jgi:hypothetical protein